MSEADRAAPEPSPQPQSTPGRKRILRRPLSCAAIAVGVLSLGLLGLIMLGKTITLAMDDASIARALPAFKPTFHLDHQHQIGWCQIGANNKRPVVFVHGSPGSMDNWLEVVNDAAFGQAFNMLLVDRPGFGRSSPGQAETSLAVQADRIVAALRPHLQQPAIWVGHSFGGPVLARIGMDAPELVAGQIYVASSVDPDLETVRWYQHAGDWAAVAAALPPPIRTTNREILPLADELRQIVPAWPTFHWPITGIHGSADTLVPIENLDFIERHATQAETITMHELPDVNHFLPWSHQALIREAILAMAGNLPAAPAASVE